jgi:hypothetical protein
MTFENQNYLNRIKRSMELRHVGSDVQPYLLEKKFLRALKQRIEEEGFDEAVLGHNPKNNNWTIVEHRVMNLEYSIQATLMKKLETEGLTPVLKDILLPNYNEDEQDEDLQDD